jgi:hypothetical protein
MWTIRAGRRPGLDPRGFALDCPFSRQSTDPLKINNLALSGEIPVGAAQHEKFTSHLPNFWG